MNQLIAQFKKIPYKLLLILAVTCFAASLMIDENRLSIVASVLAVLGAIGYQLDQ